ncbi:MAG: hypothetical protein ABI782_07960, partial [Anaerolineaceae bacterium]
EAWGRLSSGVLASAHLVSTNPLNQRQIYVDAGTLVASNDRLQTWLGIAPPGTGAIYYVDWSAGLVFSALGGIVYRLPFGQSGPWLSYSTGLPPGTVRGFSGGGQNLYALTDNGIYRTANGGASWQPSFSPPSRYVNTSAAGDGSNAVAFAAAGSEVHKTSDGGQTWNPMPPLPGAPQITSLVVSSNNPLRVVALTDRGLMLSRDGGVTFNATPTTSRLPGNVVSDVVTNVSNANQLFVNEPNNNYGASSTADGGKTWTSLRTADSGMPLYPNWASGSIVLAFGGASVQTLFRSTDSGATWTGVKSFFAGSGTLVQDRNPTTLYLFFYYGIDHGTEVWKSNDTGATWTSIGSFVGRIGTIRQRQDNGEFFADIGGLFHSADGLNWSAIGSGLPPLRLTSLDLSATTPSTIFAGFDATGGPAVFKSIDGGTTWLPVSGGLPSGNAAAIAVDPLVAAKVYVGFANGGVYGSSDGGATWSSLSAGLYDTYINYLQFSLAEPSRLLASTRSGMFSLDTGAGVPTSILAVEYYYSVFNHYFVTVYPAEISALDGGAFPGWVRTGETYAVEASVANGLNPMCRFFSATFAPKSSHFYTPYSQECRGLKAAGAWQYEGDAWQQRLRGIDGACAGGFRPYYRVYNNGAGGAPAHRYAVKDAIVAQMQAQGWIVEGAAETKAFACVPQ